VKHAGKSLKKAQKKIKPAVASVQDSIQSGLEQTQDVVQGGLGAAQVALGKHMKQARKGIKRVKERLRGVQDSVQHDLRRYARKRRAAKTVFRFGLLAGVVVALLYTPWPGSETRRQLGEWWQRLFPQQG
jgi:gas vesicle protein